jgi:hypothetical protein
MYVLPHDASDRHRSHEAHYDNALEFHFLPVKGAENAEL